MPSLTDHQSNQFTKLLLVGDSGSGKTGSMAPLVAANYKLRIMDFDNGLEPLKQFIMKIDPKLLANVEFVSLRDDYVAGATGLQVKSPKAFVKATKLLEHWKYKNDDGTETDLGDPSEWGPDCILVIDSLTFLAHAAFAWAENLSNNPDKRSIYGDAQQACEKFLAAITSEGFRTNVLVISHIRYEQNDEGKQKGFPTAIGAALGPAIPRYFNNFLRFETKGEKRTIVTQATSLIDLKTSKPFGIEKSYPIDTGLADIFEALREEPEQPKPKLVKKA